MLLVARLVELNLKVAGHAEVGDQSVAEVLNVVGKLDPPFTKFRDRLFDVITIKRNVMGTGWGTGWVRRMAAHLRFRKVEDQPSFPDVSRRKTELVSQEGSQPFRFRSVENGVHARNHPRFLPSNYPTGVEEDPVASM